MPKSKSKSRNKESSQLVQLARCVSVAPGVFLDSLNRGPRAQERLERTNHWIRTGREMNPDEMKRLRETSSGASGSQAKKADDKTTPKRPGEDDEEDEINDLNEEELAQLTLNHQQQDEAAPPPPGGQQQTWADKARKNPYPFLLYIQRSQERRLAIPKAHFDAFVASIWEARCSLNPEENATLNIDWVAHEHGRGIIATTDAISANWVKAQAAAFIHEGQNTRAWARWERGDRWVFQGFLHGHFWQSQKSNRSVSKILKMNGLSGNFQIIQWNKCANGIFVGFEADETLTTQLQGRGKLQAGICSLKLERKFRRAINEDDFLKKSCFTTSASEAQNQA